MADQERVVVTVMGQDRVGIVAGISQKLAECNANIIDISQTILQDIFAMILLVDISQTNCDLMNLQAILTESGKDLGVKIVVQHEDIFRYMHRI